MSSQSPGCSVLACSHFKPVEGLSVWYIHELETVQVKRLWIRPIITCWAAQLAEVTSFNLDNPIQILPVENILRFQAVLDT